MTSLLSYDGAIHALEIAAITLTVLNGVAAGLVLILALLDNYNIRKSWTNISYERRLPIYLASAILLGQVEFTVREILQMGSVIPLVSNDAGPPSQTCIAVNEASWWGTSLYESSNESNMVPDCGIDSESRFHSIIYYLQRKYAPFIANISSTHSLR
jgi:hypothetical protein